AGLIHWCITEWNGSLSHHFGPVYLSGTASWYQPMAQPEGGMGRTMVVQTLGMLVQAAIALPVIALAIIAIVMGSQVWGIITLMAGVLYGAGALWVGVKLGAKWYERAQPETYQSIVKVSALY